MVADVGAAVVCGLLCEKQRTSRAYCKPRPTIEKPGTALSYSSSSSIALDRLVEVALSPTQPQHVDKRRTREQVPQLANDLPGIASADSDFGATDNNKVDHDAAMKLSSVDMIKPPKQQQQMAPEMVPSKQLPGYNYNNNRHPHLAFHAMDAHKLKRLSSLPQTPQPRSSSTTTTTRYHPNSSRRFTPRFKSLLDISC